MPKQPQWTIKITDIDPARDIVRIDAVHANGEKCSLPNVRLEREGMTDAEIDVDIASKLHAANKRKKAGQMKRTQKRVGLEASLEAAMDAADDGE